MKKKEKKQKIMYFFNELLLFCKNNNIIVMNYKDSELPLHNYDSLHNYESINDLYYGADDILSIKTKNGVYHDIIQLPKIQSIDIYNDWYYLLQDMRFLKSREAGAEVIKFIREYKNENEKEK